MITYKLILEDGSIDPEMHYFSLPPGAAWQEWIKEDWAVLSLDLVDS